MNDKKEVGINVFLFAKQGKMVADYFKLISFGRFSPEVKVRTNLFSKGKL